MSDGAINTDRVFDLMGTICDGGASERELAEMDTCLLADRLFRNRYLNYCWLHVALTMDFQLQRAVQQVHQRINMGPVAPAISNATALNCGKIDPSVSFVAAFPGSLWHNTVGFCSTGWPVAYLVATVIFGIGLLVGALVHVSQPEQITKQSPSVTEGKLAPDRQTEVVGQITGMVDCQWADSNTATINGVSVRLGCKYALASGLMEITYDTGAKVILQGPVMYEVESPRSGYLSLGKLTARVEKKTDGSNPRALITGPSLFSIRTPTATVTDLGTEFGVELSKDGRTTSHVFRGSVRVQAVAADGTIQGDARVLHESQSMRVDKGDGDLAIAVVQPANPSEFVREIPKLKIKTLDLVDVVAGGDGFSGRRGRGIDVTTGQSVAAPAEAKMLIGDGRYHRVEGLPFVDGVFVPDSRRGPVQTDSAGHTFDRFGNAFNETWHYVWAGGAIPVNDPRRAISAVLGGVDYSSSGHGLLYMHANKGITFDLDAIRRANSGDKPVRFRTVVGNTETPCATGFRGNTSAKTFFADDFQTAKVGAFSTATHSEAGTSTNTGRWVPTDTIGMTDQVEIAVERKSNGAGSNKYLKIPQGFVWGTGWNVGDTDGQIVRLSAAVRVSSETGSMACLDGFTGQGNDGRSLSVCLAADGSVKFFNGRDMVTTDLVSHPDVWQHVVITANVTARTFSIKLDNQPLHTGGFWSGPATNISRLQVGNNTASGSVCFDDVTLGVIESSTLEHCKPERVSADAWVLIDGERRSGRLGFNRAGGTYPITVPIAENDRYLTLVATDGGDSVYWDWIFFGDPRLEMAPAGVQHGPSLMPKWQPGKRMHDIGELETRE